MRRIALAPVLVLATSAPALAFGPDGDELLTPEQRAERFENAMDHIDATDDQRSKIRVLIEDTLPQLKSLHEEGHALREDFHEVFLQPTVDRDEVELLRTDAVDLFDRATSTMMDLMVDAANVLTVEQREALHELKQARREKLRERLRQWHASR